MSKLKVLIKQDGCNIIFRVIEQCESLRNKGSYLEFIATNGVRIVSSSHPDLDAFLVKINGRNKDKDGMECIFKHSSVMHAETAKRELIRAFSEFRDKSYFDNADVYEF